MKVYNLKTTGKQLDDFIQNYIHGQGDVYLDGNNTFIGDNTFIRPLSIPEVPNANTDAASKKYVDDGLNTKISIDPVPTPAASSFVYGKKSGILEPYEVVSISASSGNILQTDVGGALNVGNPTISSHAANKNYVDTLVNNTVSPINQSITQINEDIDYEYKSIQVCWLANSWFSSAPLRVRIAYTRTGHLRGILIIAGILNCDEASSLPDSNRKKWCILKFEDIIVRDLKTQFGINFKSIDSNYQPLCINCFYTPNTVESGKTFGWGPSAGFFSVTDDPNIGTGHFLQIGRYYNLSDPEAWGSWGVNSGISYTASFFVLEDPEEEEEEE